MSWLRHLPWGYLGPQRITGAAISEYSLALQVQRLCILLLHLLHVLFLLAPKASGLNGTLYPQFCQFASALCPSSLILQPAQL